MTTRLSPHFTKAELVCRHCGWGEVDLLLLDGLERLREIAGTLLGRPAPVNVNSGVRCPAHNKAVGGSPNSLHLKGMAADVWVRGVPALYLARMAELVQAFGGIGLYQGRIHVDTRTDGPARWAVWNGRTVPYEEGIALHEQKYRLVFERAPHA